MRTIRRKVKTAGKAWSELKAIAVNSLLVLLSGAPVLRGGVQGNRFDILTTFSKYDLLGKNGRIYW